MDKKTILVLGAPTVDWMAIDRRHTTISGSGRYFAYAQARQHGVNVTAQPGGAALLTRLLHELAPHHRLRVRGTFLSTKELFDPIGNCDTNTPLRLWSRWEEILDNDGCSAFRMTCPMDIEFGNWPLVASKGEPDVVLLDDAADRSNNPVNEDYWRRSLEGTKRCSHAIVKFACDLPKTIEADSNDRPAWWPRKLDQSAVSNSRKLIAVTSVRDLRAAGLHINPSLSWERLISEVNMAVGHRDSPFVVLDSKGKPKLLPDWVVVTVGPSGAIIIGKKSCGFVFPPYEQEGDFERRYKGHVLGYGACMMASLGLKFALESRDLDETKILHDAVRLGAEMSRFLHKVGFEKRKSHGRLQADDETPTESINRTYLCCPYQGIRDHYYAVLANIKSGEHNFAATDRLVTADEKVCREVIDGSASVSFLTARLKGAPSDLAEVLRNIVLSDPAVALSRVPILKMGNWMSADKQEVESVRTISNAIRDYLDRDRPRGEGPLNVAVFGAPGAGKTFAIEQIAETLGISAEMKLEFNLSKYQEVNDLYQDFHKIRDLNLRPKDGINREGSVPLVIWDEFDAAFGLQPLGWLRYFLEPMYRGKFAQAGVEHFLGPCIFVFVGGTRHNWSEIDKRGIVGGVEKGGYSNDEKSAKLPDFITRISLKLNVFGPNPENAQSPDDAVKVRRALLLRQLFQKYAPGICEGGNPRIDKCIVNAFLNAASYKSGARSIEFLVQRSRLAGISFYNSSCLPSEELLAMHVDAVQFHRTVEEPI
jgi:hypothetical protein